MPGAPEGRRLELVTTAWTTGGLAAGVVDGWRDGVRADGGSNGPAPAGPAAIDPLAKQPWPRPLGPSGRARQGCGASWACSVGGGESLLDSLGDTTPFSDLVALGPGPGPHFAQLCPAPALP